MGKMRTIQKKKKAFRIESKFMNWVLTHLPTTDDDNEHDSVIQTDDSNTG